MTQNIGGLLIPLSTLMNNLPKIKKDISIIIHCQSGKRSEQAISLLQAKGFENLWNLEGGMNAYMEEEN